MKKVMAFSLWGQDPKYTVGAVRNAEQLQEFYPGWIGKFYVDATTPRGIIYQMEEYENIKIVERPEIGDWRAMFWRFEAAFDEDADIVVFRDTDCRLCTRQKNATYEWIESNKLFHIMRDHPFHKFPILGGQWGVKKNDKYDMEKLIMDFYKNKSKNKYGTDYEFFIQVLYPLIKEDSMEHDEFFGGIKFPDERDINSKGPAYVGEPFGGKDELCFPEHRETLKRYLDANK
jgi:protein O-GlcNAc transferase